MALSCLGATLAKLSCAHPGTEHKRGEQTYTFLFPSSSKHHGTLFVHDQNRDRQRSLTKTKPSPQISITVIQTQSFVKKRVMFFILHLVQIWCDRTVMRMVRRKIGCGVLFQFLLSGDVSLKAQGKKWGIVVNFIPQSQKDVYFHLSGGYLWDISQYLSRSKHTFLWGLCHLGLDLYSVSMEPEKQKDVSSLDQQLS